MSISSFQPVLRLLKNRNADFIQDLSKLVAVQSVSTDGKHQRDIERGARLICDQMRRAGLENVQILRIGKSNPYVYGDWLHSAGSPTVFLYAHQDVQPADPTDGWTKSPWKLTARHGRLYGRGAADDKGAITTQLAVISAYLETRGKIPVNVRMLVESEEEIGSPNLVSFFKKYHTRIQSDVIVVCDTENLATGLPSLTYSLRGIVQAQIEVESASRPVHSGMGGGLVADAALALNVLLARLYCGDGKPSIPAIESEVLPLTPQERAILQHLPGNEQSWRRNLGVLPQVQFAHESRRHPYEQIWRRPSVTIIAQEASSIRGRSNQILPKAAAVVSCRTVPNQNPDTVFHELQKLLTANPPWKVHVTVRNLGGVDWWMTDPHGAVFDSARQALCAGFGKEPTLIGGGGSIGFIKPLTDLLEGAPALLLGIEDPQSNPHAPNESLHAGDLHKLMSSLAHLFENLGQRR
jgi:acetylornithine deacetylase/succinyl-diaminopimelate desuccinylase-like protein